MKAIEKSRVLALLGALFSASALAEPSIAVLAMDNCEVVSSAPHAQNYRQALESRLGGEVQSEPTTVAKLGGSRSSMSLAEAERLLSGATADVFRDQVDRATRSLASVIEDVERLPPTPARYLAFTDVIAALAHTHLMRGKDGEAEAVKYYTRILRLDPSWLPNINFYSPTTRAFVSRLSTKLRKGSKVRLRVTTRPAGKTVYIDTKLIGPSPVSLDLIADSRPYTIEADWGGERRGLARTAKIEQPTDVDLDAAFEGTVFADRACAQSDGTREGRLALATRLAGVLDATTVHLLWEEEPSPKERFLTVLTVNHKGEQLLEARIRIHAGGLRFSVFDGLVNFTLTGEASQPIEPVRRPMKQEAIVVGPAGVKAPAEPVADSPSPVHVAPWISGAIAVALGAGSGALFFMADGSARQMEQTCPRGTVCSSLNASQSAKFKASHDYQTIGAIGLMVAAGAAVITTTAIILWNAISGNEAPPIAVSSSGAAVLLRF